MRRFALAVLAVAGLSQVAFAADMAVKAPARAAPAVVALYNWSGLYIGGNLGGAWGDFERRNDAGTVLNNIDASGWLAGGQIGWNWQTGNLVFGLEASLSATDLSGTQACPNPAFTCKIEADYVFIVGPRVGLAFDRFLAYLTGGYAQTKTSTSATPVTAGFNSDSTHGGWAIGGGVEYAFTPNWILGGEDIYTSFDDKRYADPTGANTPYTVDPQISIARARLSYKFN